MVLLPYMVVWARGIITLYGSVTTLLKLKLDLTNLQLCKWIFTAQIFTERSLTDTNEGVDDYCKLLFNNSVVS